MVDDTKKRYSVRAMIACTEKGDIATELQKISLWLREETRINDKWFFAPFGPLIGQWPHQY